MELAKRPFGELPFTSSYNIKQLRHGGDIFRFCNRCADMLLRSCGQYIGGVDIERKRIGQFCGDDGAGKPMDLIKLIGESSKVVDVDEAGRPICA